MTTLEDREQERQAIIDLMIERERYGDIGRLPDPIFARKDEEILMTYPAHSVCYVLAMLRLTVEILWLRLLREFPPFRLARWICKKLTM